MAREPLVSIIIPTYNYAHLLRRCLVSVLSQLDDNCELLVVDDGSADNTGAILQEIEQSYPGSFRIIRQENSGAGAARNNGSRNCSGEFLLFLDADDELTQGTLSIVCATLRRHPEADVILGGHLACYPDGKEKGHLPRALRLTPKERAEDYLIHKRVSIGHGSTVARRRLIVARPYPEKFRKREDIPVFAHLITSDRIVCIDHVMVRVNKHPTSLRHRTADLSEGYLEFVEEVFKTLPAECNDFKQRYSAQRCLSLFRSALGLGQYKKARDYFRQAISLDFRQAIRWTYLRKAIRTWLQVKQESQ